MSDGPILPSEIRPAMQGAVPSILYTCSLDGVPNAAVVSQIYWVDGEHVALSFQFFNKTIKNIRENPYAFAELRNPGNGARWVLELLFERSESSGPIFDEMDMQLEAIASASGMSGIFKLKAADVYRVLAVRKIHG